MLSLLIVVLLLMIFIAIVKCISLLRKMQINLDTIIKYENNLLTIDQHLEKTKDRLEKIDSYIENSGIESFIAETKSHNFYLAKFWYQLDDIKYKMNYMNKDLQCIINIIERLDDNITYNFRKSDMPKSEAIQVLEQYANSDVLQGRWQLIPDPKIPSNENLLFLNHDLEFAASIVTASHPAGPDIHEEDYGQILATYDAPR